MSFNLDLRNYGPLLESLEGMFPEPKDYFDFAFSSLAFGFSLSSSRLLIEGGVVSRGTKNTRTVINWTHLAGLDSWIGENRDRYRVKFLNYVSKEKPGGCVKAIPGPKEFFVHQGYSLLEAVKDRPPKKRKRIAYYLRRGEERYTVSNEVEPGRRLLTLLDDWASEAERRHFMVVRGHYAAYIRLWEEIRPENVHLINFYSSHDNRLYAVAGFEIRGDCAQITLMKHLIGDNAFPIYFWNRTLEEIFSYGVKKIFCGSTADALKQRMGLEEAKSYKIKFI